MEPNKPHRTLVVANRTAAAPLLLEEIARRRAERPTVFVLLIPLLVPGKRPDWTAENAIPLLQRAAHGPVETVTAEGDPFEAVRHAIDQGDFDDVIISTLPKRVSEWLRRDLPSKVRRLGIPVTVISQHEEGSYTIHEARTNTLAPGPG